MFDVVLTTNYSPWSRYSGGGQKSTHMLACAYAAMGLRVAVIYTKAPWEPVQLPATLPYTVHWAPFFAIRPGISSIFRWLNCFGVWRTARRISSRTTLLIGSGDEAALLGFIQGKKRFHYCNRYPNPPAWLTRVPWQSLWGWLYCGFREPRFWAQAMAARGAQSISCTSSDSLRQFQTAFPMAAAKAHAIPNGIDPCFLEAPIKSVPGTGILFFGRLTVGKGVRDLLAAYQALPETLRQDHPLTLVGQGPLQSEVQAACAHDSRISLRPWMDSNALAALIATQRLVALPSHEESFGNTMLETIALGQDLISCSAGSIPEVIQDQATLVAPEDPQALSSAIQRTLETPFDSAQSDARRAWVQSRYSWNATARALLAPETASLS